MAAPNLNPFLLGSRPITAVLSDVTITEGVSAANVAQAFWDRLAGINAISIDANFIYGSGGTSAVLRIDTALGSGGSWRNVVRLDFAQVSRPVGLTLVRSTLSATAFAELGSESVVNFIGDRLRARLTTVGVYAGGTIIDVRAQPHA